MGWSAVRRATSWLAPAVLSVVACNYVFEIDSTELAPPASDSDGDGIPNASDNCVLIANPDQADGDGDDLGDVCDPCLDGDTQLGVDNDGDGIDDGCDSCLAGTNHDEDGDGLGDACDVCPAVADADQADDDDDGIGNPCAVSPAVPNRRVFFDGFGPPHPAWNTGFKPWNGTSDGYAPTTPMVGASTFLEGPWNPHAIVAGRHVRVVASVIVPPAEPVASPQSVGLSLRQVNNGFPAASCSLATDGEIWFIASDPDFIPIPAGRTQFELRFNPSSDSDAVTLDCTIAGRTVVAPTRFDPTTIYTPSLVANVEAEFEWIDVFE